MSAACVRLAACALALLAASAAARAQEEQGEAESALARVQRDQTRIGLRLSGLREKMTRLVERYEGEGRQRNAQLLREALAAWDERDLGDLQAQIERGLGDGRLSAVEQQDALIATLTDIQAILRDRRDVDELSRQAEIARQGLAELGHLAANERRLLSATQATTDRPGALLEDSRRTAEELQRQLATAQLAGAAGQDSERALGDAALAEALAAAQAALAAEPQPAADDQAALQEALAALRERLAGDGPEGAIGSELFAAAAGSRQTARDAAERAAEAMAQARAALQAAPADATGPDEGGDEAGGDETGGADPAGTEDAADGGAEPAGPARAAMERAAEQLRSASDALQAAERSLAAARNRARSLAQASSADAARAGEQLEELAERLEAAQPESGPELLDRTRQLMEELARLARAAAEGDAAATTAAAQAGQLSIDEILAQLRARAAQAEAAGPPDAPPDPAAMDSLAERQDELAQRLQQLMQRLQELPDQGFASAAEQAGRAMQGASDALRSGRSEEAAAREREAAEKLEQAAGALAGEGQRYERLRQDEVLFRLNEELESLLDAQRELTAETAEVQAARAPDERLPRSQRRTVERLADRERELSVRAERLRAALAEDEAVAFTFALERTRDDLVSVAERLAAEETGRWVAAGQADVERRLSDLLAVLDDELERRKDAQLEEPPEGQSQPPPETRPGLVPTVAELLLVQRLEQSALARLENFARLNPELDDEEGLGEIERQLLERWSAEHVQVTEMFRKMIPTEGAGAPSPAPETPQEGR